MKRRKQTYSAYSFYYFFAACGSDIITNSDSGLSILDSPYFFLVNVHTNIILYIIVIAVGNL